MSCPVLFCSSFVLLLFFLELKVALLSLPHSVYGFEKIKAALLTYKSLHGNLLVSDMFIVPENSTDWDEELWGMKLGEGLNRIA
jgi:hypothetical protein